MTWRRRHDERLAQELQFHLDQHVRDLVGRGHDPVEARRLARLELGGVEQVKEECRDARGFRWLKDAWYDARDVGRLIRHAPGFATVVVLTLALGTAGPTVMFSVVSGVLLRPLPFAEPDRLVRLVGQSEAWNTAVYGEQNLAHLDMRDLQRDSRTLEIGGYLWDTATMSAPGEADHLVHVSITANLFDVLGLRIARGRAFAADEDRPGAADVAILSDAFWRRRFGASDAALGSTMVLDGRARSIVGIAPAELQLGDRGDVYTPLGQNRLPMLARRGPHPIQTVARLAPSATTREADAELTQLAARLTELYPGTNTDRTFTTRPLRASTGDAGPMLWLLFGGVTLVLLVACTNVTSLLLARAVSRDRELALRVALGAGRARLIRQCLVESGVLAVAGGALGVALASIGLEPFVALWPGDLPRAANVQIDWAVLVFSLSVSVGCGLLVGLAPALRAPVADVDATLRAGSRTVTGGARRLHTTLVVAEIALAMLLLAGAGALGRTLLHAWALDPGVDVRQVLVARAAVSPGVMRDPARTREAWRTMLENARRVPGVTALAMVDTVPMRAGNNQVGYRLSSAPVPEREQPLALATCVTPEYFNVVGLSLQRGRLLAEHDRKGSLNVAVIDDVMARQAFAGRDPLGQLLWIGLDDPVTVVGVVGHVRHWGLAADDRADVRAQVYYPFDQLPDQLVARWSQLMSVAVRTTPGIDPASILQPLRQAVRGDGNDQVLYEVRTLDELAGASVATQRFLLVLFGVFAALAVGLAAIGLYGVLAYATSRRRPELAVRMALGASARQVAWTVLRQSLLIACAGAAIGLALAFGAQQVLNRSVEGMQPVGVQAVTITLGILMLTALAASAAPAVRAGRVDPATALK
jgi:predicted permease